LLLASAPNAGAQDKTAEIRALLKERRSALQEVIRIFSAQYAEGVRVTLSVREALGIRRETLKVELELAETSNDRLKAIRSALSFAEDLEKRATSRRDTGAVGAPFDVALAKAEVLAIRIEILREEQKLTPADTKKNK
jgi:hypothetical protein